MMRRFENLILWSITASVGAVLLFDRDVFAIRSPLGRVVPADIAMGFVVLFALCIPVSQPERLRVSDVLVIGGAFSYAVTGIISVYAQILPNTMAALGDVLRYLLYAMYIALLNLRVGVRVFWGHFRAWMFFSVFVLCIAFGQVLYVERISPIFEVFAWENIRGDQTRIAATFRWQGPFVAFIGMTLPVLLAKVSAERRRRRAAYLLLSWVAVVCLLFSGSRSSLLVLPLSFVPAVVGVRRAHKPLVVGLLALLFLGGIHYINVKEAEGQLPAAISRVVGRKGFIEHMIDENRVRILSQGISLWQMSPVVGIGPLQLEEYIGLRAHNTYTATLIERGMLGVGGMMLFVCGLVLTVRRLLTCPESRLKPTCCALAIGMINVMIYAFTATAFEYRMFWVYLSMAMAATKMVRVLPDARRIS